jgi:hypothetical protein
MAETYKSLREAQLDRALLINLKEVLGASNNTLRRSPSGLWVLRGKYGYVATWGDKSSWGLTIEASSPRKWTNVKKKLGFLQVTQDGDREGVFHLTRLPTPEQAEAVREAVGLRKRPFLTDERIAQMRGTLEEYREAKAS